MCDGPAIRHGNTARASVEQVVRGTGCIGHAAAECENYDLGLVCQDFGKNTCRAAGYGDGCRSERHWRHIGPLRKSEGEFACEGCKDGQGLEEMHVDSDISGFG